MDGGSGAASAAARTEAPRTFVTTVARREPLNGAYLRLTLQGGDLHTFQPTAADQFVYLLAPPAGRRDLTVDGSFTWTEWEQTSVHQRPRGAYYTIRSWRPEVAEIDLLVARHDGGAAAGWAEEAQPGDAVAVWGPRHVYDPPATTRSLLLVADETGLPAVAAILEQRPALWSATVVVEMEHESLALALATRPADRVVWVRRGQLPAGTTGLLLEAVRRLSVPGDVYAWGGAESKVMTAIRRHLREQVGLPMNRSR